MHLEMIKALATLYIITLIPTVIALTAWPDAQKEIYEGKLGRFGFFISAWLASPVILLYMLITKILRR